MSGDYTPRFGFEITEEQKARADKLLNIHGMRKAIFSPILDDVLDLIEEFGGIAMGAMLSGNVKPRNIIPSLNKAKEVGEK